MGLSVLRPARFQTEHNFRILGKKSRYLSGKVLFWGRIQLIRRGRRAFRKGEVLVTMVLEAA